jgi:hypothetical protein
MFGFIQFNKEAIASEVERRSGRKVELGRMNWHVDSYHIYGKDREPAGKRLFQRLDKTSFRDRVYCFWDPMIQEIYQEAEAKVKKKIQEYDDSHP